jgi:hypothetical protein
MDTLIGLDLGKLTDYTAAIPLRRSLSINTRNGHPDRDSRGRLFYRFDVAGIIRYPKGTEYTEIVKHIVRQLLRPEMGRRPKLVMDASGVGVAVEEMFRTSLQPYPHIECIAVTITAGRAVLPVGRNQYHVAKQELIGVIRSVLESGRFKVPKGLENAELLKRELQDFTRRITAAGNETASARQSAHDDLVLACAVALWLGHMPRYEMVTDQDSDFDRLRRREWDSVSAEAAMMAAAEEEAMARDRGEVTPRMLMERAAFQERFLRDPLSVFTFPEDDDA